LRRFGGFLLGLPCLLRGLALRFPADDFLASGSPGFGTCRNRILEELHQASTAAACDGYIASVRTDQLLLVLWAVQLGKIFFRSTDRARTRLEIGPPALLLVAG